MAASAAAQRTYGRIVLGLVAFLGVLAGGTLGYVVIEGWSFLDSLFMAVTTVTTVGFREVRPLDTAGRLFTIVLALVGVGIAFYILTVMVATIIEGDLGLAFGARRMKKAIEGLKDHYIVCGYGRVGEEIARELLDRRAPFVVVDRDEDAVERARQAGVLAMLGDATDEASLTEAGIARCRALIAASDSDATNTYITLTARGLRSDVFVAARVSTPAFEAKLRQAGAARVISPYAMGGRRLAYAALQPIMTDFIDVAPTGPGSDRILAEFAIDEASGLAGKQVREALAHCRDVVPLALRDREGNMTVGPALSTLLSLGDRLMVVGGEDELRSVGVRGRE